MKKKCIQYTIYNVLELKKRLLKRVFKSDNRMQNGSFVYTES